MPKEVKLNDLDARLWAAMFALGVVCDDVTGMPDWRASSDALYNVRKWGINVDHSRRPFFQSNRAKFRIVGALVSGPLTTTWSIDADRDSVMNDVLMMIASSRDFDDIVDKALHFHTLKMSA